MDAVIELPTPSLPVVDVLLAIVAEDVSTEGAGRFADILPVGVTVGARFVVINTSVAGAEVALGDDELHELAEGFGTDDERRWSAFDGGGGHGCRVGVVAGRDGSGCRL